MEPEAKYTLVGTVVVVLVALIAAAVLWLRSSGEGRDDRMYKIYFERQSLEGLEVRSDVRMRGIRVGSVTGFRFSSTRPGTVEVFIRVEGSTPVRSSTQAIVERHLVTGIATVRLVNPSETSPLLREPPEGESTPVIAEGESVIEQFSESLNQLAQRADATMQRINALLSPQNEKALADTFENLQRLTRDASSAVLAAGSAAEEVRKLAASLAADARKLSERYASLGDEASSSLKDITGAVQGLRRDVAQLTARADQLLASGDTELRATAQSLRNAADALGVTAERLRDPSQVLWGAPEGGFGPGEGRAR